MILSPILLIGKGGWTQRLEITEDTTWTAPPDVHFVHDLFLRGSDGFSGQRTVSGSVTLAMIWMTYESIISPKTVENWVVTEQYNKFPSTNTIKTVNYKEYRFDNTPPTEHETSRSVKVEGPKRVKKGNGWTWGAQNEWNPGDGVVRWELDVDVRRNIEERGNTSAAFGHSASGGNYNNPRDGSVNAVGTVAVVPNQTYEIKVNGGDFAPNNGIVSFAY